MSKDNIGAPMEVDGDGGKTRVVYIPKRDFSSLSQQKKKELRDQLLQKIVALQKKCQSGQPYQRRYPPDTVTVEDGLQTMVKQDENGIARKIVFKPAACREADERKADPAYELPPRPTPNYLDNLLKIMSDNEGATAKKGTQEKEAPSKALGPQIPNLDKKVGTSKLQDQSRKGKGSEAGTSKGKGSEAETSKGKGSEAGTSKGKGSEAETSKGKGSEAETSKGKGSEAETSKGKGSKAGTFKGKGSEEGTSKVKVSEEVTSKVKGSEEGTSKVKGSQEEISKKKGSQEEISKKKGSQERTSKKKGSEEGTSKKKGSEEATSKIKGSQEGTSKKKGSEEATSKKKGSEEGTSKKKGSQEGTSKKKGSEEETLKKKDSQEGTSKVKGSEEGISKKKGSEEGTSKKKGSQEGTSKKKGSEAGTSKGKGSKEGTSKENELSKVPTLNRRHLSQTGPSVSKASSSPPPTLPTPEQGTSQSAKERSPCSPLESKVGWVKNDEWEIEGILDYKLEKDITTGKHHRMYKVKWKGWKSEHNSWVPEKNILSKSSIDVFWSRLKKSSTSLNTETRTAASPDSGEDDANFMS